MESISRRSFLESTGIAGIAALAATVMPTVGTKLAYAEGNVQLWIATVPSAKGDLTAAVAFDGDAIADIEVTACVDTPLISKAAIADVTQRIIDQQNVEVDVTAGATFTSSAIKSAVKQCIDSAGLDESAFSKGSDAVEKTAGEDAETDILIVGSGFAGLGAAIEALRAGASKVMIVESEAYVGGSSLLSGGGMCAFSSSTNEQIDNVLTEDDFISFCSFGKGYDGEALKLVKNVYAVNGDAFDYIVDNGFSLAPDEWTYSDVSNGMTPCFWPEGRNNHTWDMGTPESGRMEALYAMATSLGTEIRLNTRAVDLVTDGSAVTGVHVQDRTSEYTISAKKVILAMGSFAAADPDFIAKYNPDVTGTQCIAGPGCKGDAIAMAESLDVPLVGNALLECWAVVTPTLCIYGPIGDLGAAAPVVLGSDTSIIASRSFAKVDEIEGVDDARRELFRAGTAAGADILAQADQCAYAFYDSGASLGVNYKDRCQQAVDAGRASKHETVADAANAYGLDPDTLEDIAEKGGLTVPPYFVVTVYAGNSSVDTFLSIDGDCHIVDSTGAAIENLYGAGFMCYGSIVQTPGVGMHASMSYFTGAIAGRGAAASIV